MQNYSVPFSKLCSESRISRYAFEPTKKFRRRKQTPGTRSLTIVSPARARSMAGRAQSAAASNLAFPARWHLQRQVNNLRQRARLARSSHPPEQLLYRDKEAFLLVSAGSQLLGLPLTFSAMKPPSKTAQTTLPMPGKTQQTMGRVPWLREADSSIADSPAATEGPTLAFKNHLSWGH